MKRASTIVLAAVLAIGLTSIGKIKKPKKLKLGKTAEKIQKVSGDAKECQKLNDPVIPVEEEVAIGQVIGLKFISEHGGLFVNGPKAERLNKYLNTVGKNLAMQSSRPALEWTFGVLNSNDFNAFSAPGGYVFVTKGLLRQVRNEAQLAGVLAHEIAHITERHALKVYAAVKANQCKTALVGSVASSHASFSKSLSAPGGFIDLNDVANADILAEMANKVVDKITTQGFAHADEYESDAVAAGLILGAGYNPKPFHKFIGAIPSDGGSFKHHPSNVERQERLVAWMDDARAKSAEDPFVISPDSDDLARVPLKAKLFH